MTDELAYTAQFNGTRIFDFASIIPGQPKLEYVGTESPCEYTSCEGTRRNRFTWCNTFDFDQWSATETLMYTSGELDIESDEAGPGGSVYPFPKDGEFWDVDLRVSYNVTENVTDYLQVFGNVMNLLDASPPIEPAQHGGVNHNLAVYQAGIVGRFFQVGVRIKTNGGHCLNLERGGRRVRRAFSCDTTCPDGSGEDADLFRGQCCVVTSIRQVFRSSGLLAALLCRIEPFESSKNLWQLHKIVTKRHETDAQKPQVRPERVHFRNSVLTSGLPLF